MNAFIAIVCGYIIGSVPFAFLLARREGVDLRASGSGNVGASNVMRTTGLSMGVLAMMLDSIKGVVSVLLAERIATASIVPVAAGLASMLGHVYPPWLRFRGGKGVATAAGAFAVLAPAAATAASLVFIISVVATRIISVGSVNAAVTLVIVTMLARSSGAVIAGAVVAAAIILFRHRGNIARIVAGTERRVGGV
jgi:glycerol-3-phosphate acyltransferase PlsY